MERRGWEVDDRSGRQCMRTPPVPWCKRPRPLAPAGRLRFEALYYCGTYAFGQGNQRLRGEVIDAASAAM